MEEIKEWVWLVQTTKGDFCFTVTGELDKAEAAKQLLSVLTEIHLDLIGLVQRKRESGTDDIMGHIVQVEESESERGFMFFAGKSIWQACGMEAQYEAEMIRMEKARETQ